MIVLPVLPCSHPLRQRGHRRLCTPSLGPRPAPSAHSGWSWWGSTPAGSSLHQEALKSTNTGVRLQNFFYLICFGRCSPFSPLNFKKLQFCVTLHTKIWYQTWDKHIKCYPFKTFLHFLSCYFQSFFLFSFSSSFSSLSKLSLKYRLSWTFLLCKNTFFRLCNWPF